MLSLWTASSLTSRNIDSAPRELVPMPIHYWVAVPASQENQRQRETSRNLARPFFPASGGHLRCPSWKRRPAKLAPDRSSSPRRRHGGTCRRESLRREHSLFERQPRADRQPWTIPVAG